MERKKGRPYTHGAPLSVKIMLGLTQGQSDAIDEIAAFMGVHRADLIREAVDEMISTWREPT